MTPAPLQAGEVLAGRYEILATAGSGVIPGHAALARDRVFGGETAVVVWPSPAEHWAEIASTLRRLGSLRHPVLVPLVDFARLNDDGRIVAVTPARIGESLATALGRGDLTCEQVIALLIPAAAALARLGLPPIPFDPSLVYVANGIVALSALDVMSALGTHPRIDHLAHTLLESGAPTAPRLRRRLESWSGAAETSPARALTQLAALLGSKIVERRWPSVAITPLPASLEAPLRDLVEAGQGASIVVGGDAGDAIQHLRMAVRADGIPLVELATADTGEMLASLLRQLARFASPAFLWRHGDPIQHALRGVGGPAPGAFAALLETATSLIAEVAAARPLVIRFMDLGEAGPETVEALRRVTAESGGPGARACLYLLEIGHPAGASSPQLSGLLRDLEATPGYRLFAAEARRPRTPASPTTAATTTDPGNLATPNPTPTATVDAAVVPVKTRSAAAAEARAALAAGHLDAAEAALKAARKHQRAATDDAAVAVALDVIAAGIALARGDLIRARRSHRAAAGRAAAADHPDVLRVGGELALAGGQIAEASALLGRARALHARTTTTPDPSLELAFAEAELEAGRVGPAAEFATAVQAGLDPIRDSTATARARAIRVVALAAAGSPEPAPTPAAAAPDAEVRDHLVLAHARAALLSGTPAAAVVPLRAALRRVQRHGHAPLEASIRAYLADALAATGKRPAARDQARAALAIAQRSTTASAVAHRALAAASTADRRAAERHREQSLTLLTTAGALLEAEVTRGRIADPLATALGNHRGDRSTVDREPKAATAEVAAEVELPTLATGGRQTDEHSLQLLAAALRRDDPPRVLLKSLAVAAGSPWALFVPSAGRAGIDPVGNLRLQHGSVPPGLADRLAAALDRTTADSPLVAPDAAICWLPLPAHPGQLPAGALAFVARTTAAATLPAAVLAALAAPLVRDLGPLPLTSGSGAAGYHGIVGQTEPMLRLFAMLERIADNELPILLQGESGTGKELVARALHVRSSRRSAPFVPIDCAAIPESLIESELFGHRRGAFTGTVRDRKGLFEEATGGTVFLDEAANIPLAVQAKLLRVLQEREVRRVGDTVQRAIDVRLIAASNQPLEVAVREGRFREDLYFRLNVIEITLPPLRARIDDVPLLAANILAKLGDPPPAIDQAALEALAAYDWPGNVRELENELRRAHAVSRSELIRRTDLSRRVRAGLAAATTGSVPRLREAVARLERELIVRALDATGWHRGQTATLLGLSHQGLLNKIRKYEIRASERKNSQLS